MNIPDKDNNNTEREIYFIWQVLWFLDKASSKESFLDFLKKYRIFLKDSEKIKDKPENYLRLHNNILINVIEKLNKYKLVELNYLNKLFETDLYKNFGFSIIMKLFSKNKEIENKVRKSKLKELISTMFIKDILIEAFNKNNEEYDVINFNNTLGLP